MAELDKGINDRINDLAQSYFEKLKSQDDLVRLGILEQEILDVKN